MNLLFKDISRSFIRALPAYRKYIYELNNDTKNSNILENRINYYINNVPFYNKYRDIFRQSSDINNLPIIRKEDIYGQEAKFVYKNLLKNTLRIVETGGTTGLSLKLYRSFGDSIVTTALIDSIFSLIGNNLKIAILRGQKPTSGIFQKINNNTFIFSSYDINESTISNYISLLQEYKINCLHVYPSSLIILCKLIKTKYGKIDLPNLKGFFSSSEVLTIENKKLIKELFPNTILIDYYAQNEQTCCALSIDYGHYIFNKNYGYTEFVKTNITNNENYLYKIVSTSLMSKTMPFIRYDTDDYVEIDKNGNIVSIVGRSTDFAVNKNGAIVPCIVLTRDCSLKNVISFQYHQDKIGHIYFNVVVNKYFNNIDISYIKNDFKTSFNNNMDCDVIILDKIERTKIGKQKRLIQELNLDYFKNT